MTRSFTHDGAHFLRDGVRFPVFGGEMHYFRIPRPYWRHRLQCARAMGLNTISTYLPWNLHEARPGVFDFAGDLDVAAYCRMAAEEGLAVILRPGPYICSEWDFGGLPSWLLAEPGIKVRCADQRWLAAVRRYILRVGQECAGLQWHRGGPIVLTQVENEYGAFANDRAYMDAMVGLVREAGFDGQLYTCDWATPVNLKAGEVSGAVTVANFGSRAHEQIPELRRLRPGQPSMCGEFWAGWFDTWGKKRNGGPDPAPVLAEIRWMLENATSFNFYMFHGGTTFGLMAGANLYEAYVPTVSSYDFWAPLDEAGRPTAKYHALRDVLAAHQPDGATLPAVPRPAAPVVAIPRIAMSESAALFDNLPTPVAVPQPVPMEALGQAYGLVLYRSSIAGLGDQELRVVEAHDFAKVILDGRLLGTLDRRKHDRVLKVTGNTGAGNLDILVDTMGRVNFGHQLLDRKGITDRVEYGGITLMGWQAYPLPLDAALLASLRWKATDCPGPAFHRGAFDLAEPGDTFLDLREWKRGVVWVNGHCLSRFWRIGPQQTCFLPGCWLRRGRNDVVVFDLESEGRRGVSGLVEPILDEVVEELVPAVPVV